MILNKNIKPDIKKIDIRYNNGLCLEEYDGNFICNNKREEQEDLCKFHIVKQFNFYDNSKNFKFTFDFPIKNENINIHFVDNRSSGNCKFE